MPRVVVLLHLYLIVRIVFCPCLTGQSVHDRSTRSLFSWGGAANLPPDDLGNPEDRASEAGVCMCDGATSPSCPEFLSPDRTSVELGDPDPPVILGLTGLDLLAPARASRPAEPHRAPIDARTVRALLQIFRC